MERIGHSNVREKPGRHPDGIRKAFDLVKEGQIIEKKAKLGGSIIGVKELAKYEQRKERHGRRRRKESTSLYGHSFGILCTLFYQGFDLAYYAVSEDCVAGFCTLGLRSE